MGLETGRLRSLPTSDEGFCGNLEIAPLYDAELLRSTSLSQFSVPYRFPHCQKVHICAHIIIFMESRTGGVASTTEVAGGAALTCICGGGARSYTEATSRAPEIAAFMPVSFVLELGTVTGLILSLGLVPCMPFVESLNANDVGRELWSHVLAVELLASFASLFVFYKTVCCFKLSLQDTIYKAAEFWD